MSRLRPPLCPVWSSPTSTRHFALVRVFLACSVPGAQQSRRASPALAPAAAQQLSRAGTRVFSTRVHERTEHPPAYRACRAHRAAHLGPAYLRASGQGERRGSGGGAATTGAARTASYLLTAGFCNACGKFHHVAGTQPVRGGVARMLTCDARRG